MKVKSIMHPVSHSLAGSDNLDTGVMDVSVDLEPSCSILERTYGSDRYDYA